MGAIRTKHNALDLGLSQGCARSGKLGKCGHTCCFCGAENPAKHLLGSLPKPGCLRPDALASGLNFGTKCLKEEKLENRTKLYPGISQNVSTILRKPGRTYNYINHSLNEVENPCKQGFFRVKFPHISPAFPGIPSNRKRKRFPTNKNTPHKVFLPVPSAGRVF